jgi:hypothetical protein
VRSRAGRAEWMLERQQRCALPDQPVSQNVRLPGTNQRKADRDVDSHHLQFSITVRSGDELVDGGAEVPSPRAARSTHRLGTPHRRPSRTVSGTARQAPARSWRRRWAGTIGRDPIWHVNSVSEPPGMAATSRLRRPVFGRMSRSDPGERWWTYTTPFGWRRSSSISRSRRRVAVRNASPQRTTTGQSTRGTRRSVRRWRCTR